MLVFSLAELVPFDSCLSFCHFLYFSRLVSCHLLNIVPSQLLELVVGSMVMLVGELSGSGLV